MPSRLFEKARALTKRTTARSLLFQIFDSLQCAFISCLSNSRTTTLVNNATILESPRALEKIEGQIHEKLSKLSNFV